MKNSRQFPVCCLLDCEFDIILEKQNMKKLEIDGKELIIYEDGSVRIPQNDMHLCLDFMDIARLYKESKEALNKRAFDCKDTDRNVKRSMNV
jgi:hypothetical protein